MLLIISFEHMLMEREFEAAMSGSGGGVGGVGMEEVVCCFSGGSPPLARETYR